MSTASESTGKLGPQQRTQVAWITAGALAVFVGMRFLPTGTNLNHMDFRVSGQNAIDFAIPPIRNLSRWWRCARRSR